MNRDNQMTSLPTKVFQTKKSPGAPGCSWSIQLYPLNFEGTFLAHDIDLYLAARILKFEAMVYNSWHMIFLGIEVVFLNSRDVWSGILWTFPLYFFLICASGLQRCWSCSLTDLTWHSASSSSLATLPDHYTFGYLPTSLRAVLHTPLFTYNLNAWPTTLRLPVGGHMTAWGPERGWVGDMNAGIYPEMDAGGGGLSRVGVGVIQWSPHVSEVVIATTNPTSYLELPSP